MTSGEQMYGDLFPGVPEPVRTGRNGNPLEVSVALAQNQLTTDELNQILFDAGTNVLEGFKGIKDEKLKSMVASGVYKVWLMKQLTNGLIKQDENKLGSISEMKRPLDNEERIMSQRANYQPEVVKSLVEIATSDDRDAKRRRTDIIMGHGYDHMKGLDYCQGGFGDYLPLIPSESSKRGEATRYVLEDRVEDIRTIKNTFQSLSGLTSELVNTNNKE